MVATAVQGRSAISAPPGSAGDVTLACMLAAKDPRALDEIYRRHAAAVMGAARRITRDAALAEDITQDGFVRLWRAPAKYDPNRGSLRAFLVTVARGRSIDLIRSETARRSREERDGAPLVSEAAPADEEELAHAGRAFAESVDALRRAALERQADDLDRRIELATNDDDKRTLVGEKDRVARELREMGHGWAHTARKLRMEPRSPHP